MKHCPRQWIIFLIILLMFGIAGCGGDKGEQKLMPENQQAKVGISFADMERNGNQIIKQTLQQAAQKDQSQLLFADAKKDGIQQKADLEKMIEKKVKVVVLQVADAATGPDLVRMLTEKKIKVIALESLPVNTPVDAYITSDHYQTGMLQVHYLESVLPTNQKWKVLVLEGDEKDQMAQEITAGVTDGMKKSTGLELLSVVPHSQYDVKLVKTNLEKMYNDGQKFDAVLANDSSMALAAVEFLKEKQLKKQVVTVGAGGSPLALQALSKGEHDGEVDNRPDMLGSLVYEAAKDMAEGKSFPYDSQIANGDYTVPMKKVPSRIIQKDNLYLVQDRLKGAKEGGADQEGSSQEKSSGGDSSGGQEGQQGQEGQEGGQSGQSGSAEKPKTTLRITTQEGKVIEVEIDGEVKSIESKTSSGSQSEQSSDQKSQSQ